MEAGVWGAARLGRTARGVPRNPDSIFVLRNNDIGDLLVVTPLFEALRTLFPDTRLVAGVGDWNRPVLEHNPHLSGVMSVNAPWHNRFVRPQGFFESLQYILASPEANALAHQRFELGIDVLGSPYGSGLMLRCGIPARLGVRGYAGGHSAAQQCVPFRGDEYVGRAALRFAEILGVPALPSSRPQLFLTEEEREEAEATWQSLRHGPPGRGRRIILGPGGGFAAKCWPFEEWKKLAQLLAAITRDTVLVVGGKQDAGAGEALARVNSLVKSVAGRTGLRQTFSLVASADLVLCNSSMLMHVAAAFAKPAIVLLGDFFPSAGQHAAQWSGGDHILVLGKDQSRTVIFSAVEVFELMQRERLGRLAA